SQMAIKFNLWRKEMKRVSLVFALFLLVVASQPASQASAKQKGDETIVGFIGDSQCGLNHPMNMGDAKACTLKCVDGGGKFILGDRDHKMVCSLDDEAQSKAREFAGQKVKVTGHIDKKANSIHVTKIEAAA